jgi:pimeloyl-ACP methyl ester carboxylesterase
VLATVEAPAVVIAGEEDELITPAEAAAMAAALPDGRLVTVPNAGHLPPIEAPDPVTGALADLLDRVGGRPC